MEKNFELKDSTMLCAWCDCSLYKHTDCFELKMRYEDCKNCTHSGSCDYDVECTRNLDYIREQLDKLSNDQLFGYVSEYIYDDIEDKENNREWLEQYTIWLAAGDLIDDIAMGYLEYRLCDESYEN